MDSYENKQNISIAGEDNEGVIWGKIISVGEYKSLVLENNYGYGKALDNLDNVFCLKKIL